MEDLAEGLSGRYSGEGTGGAAIVGERLDVDSGRALVLDDGTLGRDAGGGEGSAHDGSEELHFDGLGKDGVIKSECSQELN